MVSFRCSHAEKHGHPSTLRIRRLASRITTETGPDRSATRGPALLLGSVTGSNPILRSTGLRHVEPRSVGALHAWVRTHHGLWIGRCVIQARIGQSHTVLLDVWAPADTIQPEPAVTGPPNTQHAISSGASAYYYDYDSTGTGTLRCCPDGQVAHTDPDGHVHCGHNDHHTTTGP